jgi:tripartite-type tricarboxylate transporter receptor subunit TctC
MITRRKFTSLTAAAIIAPTLMADTAFGQAWPTRFVRIVVPFPPGSPPDVVSRLLATRFSEIWGQQVVIENKQGAGGNIGTEAVAR